MVNALIDNLWPNSFACKINDALFKKYESQDRVSRIELWQALNAITITVNDDPTRLFESLSSIQNWCSTASFMVLEEELIATVLDKVLRKYDMVLSCEMCVRRLTLTLSELHKAMNQLWHTMYMQHVYDGKEMTLAQVGLVSDLGLACYRCSQHRHKALECPRLQGGSKRAPCFTSKCSNCGKSVHRDITCYDDPKTQH